MKRENIKQAVKIDERIRVIEENIDSWQNCTKFYQDSIQITPNGSSYHSVKTVHIDFSVMKTLALAKLDEMLLEANEELNKLD